MDNKTERALLDAIHYFNLTLIELLHINWDLHPWAKSLYRTLDALFLVVKKAYAQELKQSIKKQ